MTEEKEQLSFDDYHDRGMKKWAGFYLSEHTAIMETLKQTEQAVATQKEQLTASQISDILQEALLKDLTIAIQKEEVDSDGHYSQDSIGKIQGHDELGLYIDGQKIGYDEIRHVAFHKLTKWSDFSQA